MTGGSWPWARGPRPEGSRSANRLGPTAGAAEDGPMGAGGVAGELGMRVAETAEGLSAPEPRSRWRMEVTDRADGVTVLNDAYNANPESVRAALDTLAVMARGRRAFAVLGVMNELGASAAARHEE